MSLADFVRTTVTQKEEADRQRRRRRTWDEWILIRIGAPLAYVLLKTPISAPQVLFIMLITGMMGPFLIMRANTAAMLTGVLLLMVSTWMDQADGIVYRYREKPAVRGAFLDRFNHALIYPLTYTSFGVAAYRTVDDWAYIVAGMAGGMFRDAYDTLYMYESKFIEQNRDTVQRIRGRTFFQSGMYKQETYFWVTPFFILRNVSGLIAVHLITYPIMLGAIILGLVPQLVWFFLAVFSVRFFSYALVTLGVTLRGK